MAEGKQLNMRNPAVKRILQEVKEMQRETSKEFMSMPLEVGPKLSTLLACPRQCSVNSRILWCLFVLSPLLRRGRRLVLLLIEYFFSVPALFDEKAAHGSLAGLVFLRAPVLVFPSCGFPFSL